MTHQTNVVASTPAGGGDVTPAPDDRSTSLAKNSGEASGVVEPPKPEASPAAAGSNENLFDEAFDFDLRELEDDEMTRFGIDTDGRLRIDTPFDGSLELPAAQTLRLYEFLMDTMTVWRPACKR